MPVLLASAFVTATWPLSLMPAAAPSGPMLGMRISVQEYPAAFDEPIVKISVNALVTLTRWMNDAFMASPFVVFRRRCNRRSNTGRCVFSARNLCFPPAAVCAHRWIFARGWVDTLTQRGNLHLDPGTHLLMRILRDSPRPRPRHCDDLSGFPAALRAAHPLRQLLE